MATAASGRSMEKFATLLTTSVVTSPLRNASNSRCRSRTVVEPLITGAPIRSPMSSSWSRNCPMTRVGSPACRATSCSTTWVLRSLVAHSRYRSSGSAVAYSRRSRSGRVTRTSTQSAGAMYPWVSMSFHGAS